MAIKKLVLAGAIAASLAGAGLVGALVGSPSLSYAEEAADEQSGGDAGTPGDRGRGPGPDGPASFDVAAETLGITEEELRTELAAGESITSVALAQEVDVQTVIDALIADSAEHVQEHVDAGDLDAEEAAERTAELPDRIAEFVAREGLPSRGDC